MPPARRHAVCDVVRVERARRECHHGDERVADDLEIGVKTRVLLQRVDDLLRGADDGVARFDIPGLADAHETRPAAGDEGAGAGAGNRRRGVHAAGPVRGDEVLVGAQGSGAVENGGVALGSEAVLVGVAADASDALEAEVEELSVEAGALEERHEEGAQAAVDVQRDLALDGELGERGDVVDDAVWEVGRGADEEDGVAVDEAGDAGDVDLVGGSWAGYQVDLDAEVFSGFVEGCVSCIWEDPKTVLAI